MQATLSCFRRFTPAAPLKLLAREGALKVGHSFRRFNPAAPLKRGPLRPSDQDFGGFRRFTHAAPLKQEVAVALCLRDLQFPQVHHCGPTEARRKCQKAQVGY